MRSFSRWLLRDEQRDLFEYLYANVVNLVFLVLIALVLWPLGGVAIALHLAKGYWIFWTVVIMAAALLAMACRILRIEHRPTLWDVYLILVIGVSAALQAGWSAFAALTFHDFTAASNIWAVVIVYVVALLSCYVAYVIVSALFNAHHFRPLNLVVTLASFIVFTVWPQAGKALYGWFFNLF